MKSDDRKVDLKNSSEPPVADENSQRMFSLPQGYEPMTNEELNKWSKYEYEKDE